MDPRFSVLIDALEPDLPPLFSSMEAEAERDRVPVLRRETASLLHSLLRALEPERILEIGTAIGYSALLMHRAQPKAEITSLELRHDRLQRAEYYIREAGAESSITLLEGDAGELLKNLKGSFDFIFLDGPKAQYPVYFPELDRLLQEGGCLFTDNILQEGSLLDSRFAVDRRDRTIHSRLRDFLTELYHNTDYDNSLLPLGDGVLLSVKRKRKHDD